MASQLSRAACSVPANIAEGVGQPSAAICARHLGIAIGSLNECDTHLRILAELSPAVGDVSYLLEESKHLRRMLLALRAHHLQRSASPSASKPTSTASPSTAFPLDP
jgi:four helix bundle protein